MRPARIWRFYGRYPQDIDRKPSLISHPRRRAAVPAISPLALTAAKSQHGSKTRMGKTTQ